MAIKPIEILINAKDNASGVFDKLSGKLKLIGAAIVGYFSARAFIGAVQGAADLEAALSRVQAASGASAEEMARMKDAAEQASLTTKFSSTEAAGALENLTKAGLSANDAIATLPAALALAQAGGVELGLASEYLTKAVMGMGLAFEDAGRVADVLAKGANATNTSVDGLAQALSFAAPTAASLGVSLESTVAILGKFADAGIDASRAGTSLNNIMSQFSDPASKFRRELAAAGITTTNFEDALHQLAESGPRGERAINSVGRAAGPALRALLNQGMGALDELTAGLRDAEGSAAETARIMDDNLNGVFKRLGNTWKFLRDKLAEPVLPVLNDGIDKLVAGIRRAVDSGVIAQFGDAIAKTFEVGITWAGKLFTAFDFQPLAARLSAFASDAGTTFDNIAEKARNAGNVVKLAWNVMAGGVNTILAGIYGVGAAFSGMAQLVQDGLAMIMRGVAKVTFGGVSASFREMAAEIQLSADATGAVMEEFGNKAAEALGRATENALDTREAWSALTETVQDTSAAVGPSAEILQALAEVTDELGDAATAAADKAKAAADVHVQAAAQTDQARESLEALRTEYQQAIDTGNLQRAAEVMQELRRQTKSAAGTMQVLGRSSEEAAADIMAAFQRAGVETQQELQFAADQAREDFELIAKSGQASSEGLSAAWRRAAEAAIKANDGIAPSWVKATAAARDYALAVDEAGKASIITAEEQKRRAEQEAEAWRRKMEQQDRERQREEERARAERERQAEAEARERAADSSSRDMESGRVRHGNFGSEAGMGAGAASPGIQNYELPPALAQILGQFGQAGGGGGVASVVRIEAGRQNYNVDTTTQDGRSQLESLLRDLTDAKRRAA